MHTIYHVDVVAYIAAIYLRCACRPSNSRAGPRAPVHRMPDLRLIFQKQRATMLHSPVDRASRQMREDADCVYPEVPADRVRVLPWGAPPVEHGPGDQRGRG
ncbi:MAG: hypothetical protein U0Q16_24895 [Bryobacteraceae bacterium]